ncbi:MAG: DUF2142 domain-containing protein [Candidatus Promineifilaceae bacterium]
MYQDQGHERNARLEGVVIGLLLLIMLLKGALWSLALPLWQGPDEEDHYNVIQFVAELGHLPDTLDTYLVDEVALSRELADVGRLPYAPEQRQAFSDTAIGPGETAFADLDARTRSSFDLAMVGKLNKATPLYYMLAALPYRLTASQDLLVRAHFQRLVSLIMSAGIVVVAYLTARELFPQNGAMRLTVPILVAFQPMLTQMSAVVSVDGFYFLLYSLLIWLSVRILRDGLTWKNGVVLGTVYATGLLTKPTLNGFAPLVVLLIAYDFWRGRGRRASVFAGALAAGFAVLLLSSWWILRSLRINHDLLYFNPVVEGHRIIQNPYFGYTFLGHMADYYQSVVGGIFVSWWAHFGWVDTALPPLVYTVLRILTGLAIAGLLLTLWQRWPTRPSFDSWQAGDSNAPLPVWLFMALTAIVPIILLQAYDLTFWWQYGNGRGLQGRYWLGTVIPMLTLFALGLLALVPPRWRASAHNLLRAGMIVLNFVALLGYILPRYYL